MAIRVTSVSGRSRVRVRNGNNTKTYTSSGSSSNKPRVSSSSNSSNSISRRTAELQAQGIDRGNASKIANAESKGQKLTNISVSLANQIKSSGTSSSAIRSQEVERKSKFTPSNPQARTRATINNQVYAGATQREIMNQRLAPNTRARLLRNESQLRKQLAQAQRNVRNKTATQRDIDIIRAGRNSAIDRQRINNARSLKERAKIIAEIDAKGRRRVADALGERSRTIQRKVGKIRNTFKAEGTQKGRNLLKAKKTTPASAKGTVSKYNPLPLLFYPKRQD